MQQRNTYTVMPEKTLRLKPELEKNLHSTIFELPTKDGTLLWLLKTLRRSTKTTMLADRTTNSLY